MSSSCRNPVFILTASRSGSTLLRFILDTHPDFACPPETMIAGAVVPVLRTWDILDNASGGQQRLVTDQLALPAEAADLVRVIVDRLYGPYLARRGKPRWCDKSLDSIMAAQLLASVYPEARFICLYRHCMDVIASGAEACPWGVSRFGFDPYVAQNPGNTVASIGNYWADWATMMLSFEQEFPDRCMRVRYEDLAAAPEEVTAGLLSFVGAAPMPGITAACFTAPHEGDGPGDEKIWFTTKVTTETMGRGGKVPADALPSALRDRINECLTALDYRTVGHDWNSLAHADPRMPGTGPQAPVNGTAVTTAPEHPVVAALRERVGSRAASDPDFITSRWPVLAGQAIRFSVETAQGRSEFTWAADPAGELRANDPVVTFFGPPELWRGLLDGRVNMITEIRNGRLRCVNRRDAHRVRSDEVHAVAWLLGLAQVPLLSA